MATRKSKSQRSSLSPVSPMSSNGETWKYPPNTRLPQLKQGARVVKEKSFSEKSDSANKNRVSRPFEQPYSTAPPLSSAGQGFSSHRQQKQQKSTARVPMQADMKRADSYLRQQPSAGSRIPQPIKIPPPAYQYQSSRNQPQQEEAHVSTRQHSHHQKTKGSIRTQGPTRPHHQGWNPLAEQSQPKDHRARNRDLEMQKRDKDEFASLRGNSKKDTEYYAGRRCFWFIMLMMILGVVFVVIVVKRNQKKYKNE